MKKIVFLVILLTSGLISGQRTRSSKMGQATVKELKMNSYSKDSTAKAVVLYEDANIYTDDRNNHKFKTDYYSRVKFFDKSEFDKGTIKIRLYKEEIVRNIKAITYNLVGNKIMQTSVTDENIFKKQINEDWREASFTLPNLKEGSVIEYKYSIISPYPDIDDWYFQQSIPVKKSVYNYLILGNWKYKTRLVGYKKLDEEIAKVKKACTYIPGIGKGDCLNLHYAMNDVPAFEEEDFMLSKKNYLSRLVFDLVSFTNGNGDIKSYTKSWNNADKTLKEWYLDNQTGKTSFFKKNIPSDVLTESDELKRAKKTFYFIQNRMSWNENYRTKTIRVKKTYEEKSGSVDAINIVLFNALKAANIKCNMVMLSTRENGFPTKLYPVTDDFNYAIVKVYINNESYFLDASEKSLSFGELPLRTLNGEGRVLDFKKGSYWEKIVSKKNNSKTVRISLTPNNTNSFKGKVNIVYDGFFASNKKTKLSKMTLEEKMDEIENNIPFLEVDDFEHKNLDENEKKLFVNHNINFDENDNEKIIRLNPFFYENLKENPFKLKERFYNVDFGFTRTINYSINIEKPKGYTVTKLPKKTSLTIPSKNVKYIQSVTENDNSILIFYKLSILKKTYSSTEYHYLKEYFNQIIKHQKELVEFKKN